ncbi:MAG: M2 family metallopeptidase [Verrucomicrobia bacterium]|nr:MAG: M2 family metallopeptidase [Verrucomicrobiota bacterium]
MVRCGARQERSQSRWQGTKSTQSAKELSTRAMIEYFKPLMSWLEERSKGRQIG